MASFTAETHDEAKSKTVDVLSLRLRVDKSNTGNVLRAFLHPAGIDFVIVPTSSIALARWGGAAKGGNC